MNFHIRIFLVVGLVAGALDSASAQQKQIDCGAPPQLDQRLQNDETIKGNIQGKAQFLSRLIGSADLGGQIVITKKELYVQSKDFYPAQQDAYLNYLFCSIIRDDTTLTTPQKLEALIKIRTLRPQGSKIVRVLIEGKAAETGSGGHWDGCVPKGCTSQETDACVTPQHGGTLVPGSGTLRIIHNSPNSKNDYKTIKVDTPLQYCVRLVANTGACETAVSIMGIATAVEEYTVVE